MRPLPHPLVKVDASANLPVEEQLQSFYVPCAVSGRDISCSLSVQTSAVFRLRIRLLGRGLHDVAWRGSAWRLKGRQHPKTFSGSGDREVLPNDCSYFHGTLGSSCQGPQHHPRGNFRCRGGSEDLRIHVQRSLRRHVWCVEDRKWPCQKTWPWPLREAVARPLRQRVLFDLKRSGENQKFQGRPRLGHR